MAMRLFSLFNALHIQHGHMVTSNTLCLPAELLAKNESLSAREAYSRLESSALLQSCLSGCAYYRIHVRLTKVLVLSVRLGESSP